MFQKGSNGVAIVLILVTHLEINEKTCIYNFMFLNILQNQEACIQNFGFLSENVPAFHVSPSFALVHAEVAKNA